MAEPILLIEDLHATVEGKEILRGVNLKVLPGEIHAIMGPNGSGKSTLANVLMGKPGYEIAQGRILYRGEDLSGLAPEERARKGIFLAFQNPLEIPGVSVVTSSGPPTTPAGPTPRSAPWSSAATCRPRWTCSASAASSSTATSTRDSPAASAS